MSKLLVIILALGIGFPSNFIKLNSFKTTFHQETKSPYFPSVEDDGILIVDGCKFRFEYTTNEKRITICNCEKIFQINGEDGDIFEYSLEELKNNPFLKILNNRGSIEKDFIYSKISENPVVYRLVPKYQENKDSLFQVLKLTLNKEENKMLKMEIIDENNQIITYKFGKIEENKKFSEKLFQLGEKKWKKYLF